MKCYAIVAPGYSTVTTDYKVVERAKVFYPYLKWRKCDNEQSARDFIAKNYTAKRVELIYNYGDTFPDLYVTASYTIANNAVYYVIDTRRVGNLKISFPNILIEYKANKIFIKLPNAHLSPALISGHMSAINYLLCILGDYIDINLEVPNFSVYYALTQYAGGNSRTVKIVRDKIANRLCKVAYTLKLEDADYE